MTRHHPGQPPRCAHHHPARSLETIQLHAQAHHALATALHCLMQPECTPEQLQTATARAVRGATLLKRASAAATFNRTES